MTNKSKVEALADYFFDGADILQAIKIGIIADRNLEIWTRNDFLTKLVKLVEEVRAEGEWTQDVPTEQGWYWHWSGDRADAPFPLSVLKHGAGSQGCFVSLGQAGFARSIECDEYGGWWRRLLLPTPPRE